ncbi:MAG: GntR family transcriptional regulator [Deltaproteobacteria bacterium]|nr:GntR family transcriptional regulator [Deltaproteobacteria bacterium]
MIKEKIIWLDVEPGSVLNPAELARSLKVSRTPIKEALIFLQAEEWILRDGSHFMVTPLSLHRLNQITEIRYMMEVQANVMAMNRITNKEIDELHELEEEIRQLHSKSPIRQIHSLEIKFHQKIFEATQNPQLARMLEQLLLNYLRFWLSIPRKINTDTFHNDRRELIQAIEMKDEGKVRAAAIDHIKKSMNEIMHPIGV